ncbi:MAG: 3,4-dihydroxy-2-butanone-4-phosphate synthase [Planctomycetota bacterium]
MTVNPSQRAPSGSSASEADPQHADGAFAPIDEILDELRAGRMVVLTDDEDRENEGDLVLPAEFVTPEAITFMLSVARGYMCLSLTEADCDRLDLHGQSAVNTTVRGTPFTVSIDAEPRFGVTTGVSAKDRAATILRAIDPESSARDFLRPGHINPLRARDGGVLVRIGQTEGSIDLCKLAGLTPAAVIIEIMRDDGEMARVPDLVALCNEHGLKMCSVRQLIEHRLARQSLVERVDPVQGQTIETPEGVFNLVAFRSVVDHLPHLALTVGDVGRLDADGTPIETGEPTLVRVHRRDLLGDIFGAGASSGGARSTSDDLRGSMRMIQEAGRGAVVYLRPSWADSTLSQRLSVPFGASEEDTPRQSVSPATVEYGTGSQILRALGLRRLRLLSNSAADYPQLEAFGLEITDRVPIV